MIEKLEAEIDVLVKGRTKLKGTLIFGWNIWIFKSTECMELKKYHMDE